METLNTNHPFFHSFERWLRDTYTYPAGSQFAGQPYLSSPYDIQHLRDNAWKYQAEFEEFQRRNPYGLQGLAESPPLHPRAEVTQRAGIRRGAAGGTGEAFASEVRAGQTPIAQDRQAAARRALATRRGPELTPRSGPLPAWATDAGEEMVERGALHGVPSTRPHMQFSDEVLAQIERGMIPASAQADYLAAVERGVYGMPGYTVDPRVTRITDSVEMILEADRDELVERFLPRGTDAGERVTTQALRQSALRHALETEAVALEKAGITPHRPAGAWSARRHGSTLPRDPDPIWSTIRRQILANQQARRAAGYTEMGHLEEIAERWGKEAISVTEMDDVIRARNFERATAQAVEAGVNVGDDVVRAANRLGARAIGGRLLSAIFGPIGLATQVLFHSTEAGAGSDLRAEYAAQERQREHEERVETGEQPLGAMMPVEEQEAIAARYGEQPRVETVGEQSQEETTAPTTMAEIRRQAARRALEKAGEEEEEQERGRWEP